MATTIVTITTPRLTTVGILKKAWLTIILIPTQINTRDSPSFRYTNRCMRSAREFARVLREMQLGQSRQSALESLSRRSRQEDLARFVTAVLQADRLGIAISGILTEQAAEMRAKRRDRARERAQKVPVKILLPVIVCFLPGIFIIVLGPAAIDLAELMGNLGG